ncbi:RagB/SusD family nutrient uptake outer membrane protein [Puia sp. P3]|uniref:RagB/SusD family nutrient uptake outer membrane protein n=1 Tax=Puia sp. P3 TaxID=3423952 RepID=UPI003D66EC1A
MKFIKPIIILLVVAGALPGCRKYLDKEPFTSLNPGSAFKTVSDLQLYTNSFYVYQMPSANTMFTADNTSDYISGNNVPAIMTAQVNANNPLNANAWSRAPAATGSWPELRNINYFLQNNVNPAISDSVRNMYSGIARFFRAWWYYNMVKEFGDVPWVGTALGTTDSSMYKPRDPRTLVMDSVEADLDYAIAHAPAAKDGGVRPSPNGRRWR